MTKGLVVLALAASLAATLPALAQTHSVNIGGQTVSLANPPITVGAETLIPVRDALAQMGATGIQFYPETGRLTFIYQGHVGVINLSARSMTFNGTTTFMSMAPRLVNGRYYVPVSSLANVNQGLSGDEVRVLGYRSGVAPIPTDTGANTFTFNGQSFTYTSPTWYMGGILMVPLNETMSAVGVTIPAYQEGDLQVPFIYNGQNILLNVLSGYAFVGTQARVLSRPVVSRDGIIYVPATFVAQLIPGFGISGMRR